MLYIKIKLMRGDMLIEKNTSEGEAFIASTSNKITLMLIGDMSTVTATLQQPDGEGGWNPVIIDGVTQELSATNTLMSIYAPVKLRLFKSAGSDCGVTIANSKDK